jgi:DNA-binding SARP family transcriptional activator
MDRERLGDAANAEKFPRNGKLALHVLGAVRVTVEGHPVRLRGRKCTAVLAYLALVKAGGETRERLCGLLWSDSSEAQARASLRQVVRELRTALEPAGFEGFAAGRLSLELDPARLEVDVGEVTAAGAAGRVHPRLLETPRLAETLLRDHDDLDPSFRAWLLARRQTLHQQLLGGLEPRLRAAAEPDRGPLAIAILRLEPTHEEACRALMRLRAEAGDVAAALHAYRLLWTVLDEEYGMEPSATTQHLVAEIKQGRLDRLLPERRGSARQAPPRRTAEPDGAARPALLVQPFALVGVDSDRAPLVEGLRHNLIARLVGLGGCAVLVAPARTAAALPAAKPSTAYAIEATATQAGGMIDMVLTMRRNDAQLYIWSERFELQLATWFAAQQRIVRRIAMSLNLRLPDRPTLPLAAIGRRAPDLWLPLPVRTRRPPGSLDRKRLGGARRMRRRGGPG